MVQAKWKQKKRKIDNTCFRGIKMKATNTHNSQLTMETNNALAYQFLQTEEGREYACNFDQAIREKRKYKKQRQHTLHATARFHGNGTGEQK